MKTLTAVAHKVQLVDGVFTATEAKDVVNSLINEKVNFHKIQRLAMCEGDCDSDTSYDDGRVAQLLQEKENFKEVYQEAKLSGKKVRISGVLTVDIID
ncbi:hypothetical protein [Maribacter sp. 2-571]|uniref:hypothetical protein n=1 Tax=Maribacter sp. 2-571 TaxID=3417569 RepID=UPI003D33C3D3